MLNDIFIHNIIMTSPSGFTNNICKPRQDSTELKEFLSKVEVGELVMVASYDDAAFR